jgi:predicted extracellular nuclease
MKKFSFIFLLVFISSANIGWAQCTELFFSEYIEGSSNNKGVEIYNPSDVAVDLSNYQIYTLGNGGSFFNTLDLTGMLAPGDVYVVTTDQADSVMQAQADTVLGFPSVVHFNGDDAVALVNLTTSDTVDLIGELGIDPGTEWPVGSGSTKEYTLVRMPSVQEGTFDWAVGATQWMVFPQNTFDSLGAHTMNPCESAGPNDCAVDLFFSEYIEGSSNNKGVEIYNPFDSAVDLSNYQIYNLGNGGSFSNTLDLVGMLAPGDVYVVTTDQADSVMQAQADTVLGFPSVVHFNGDDAVALVNLMTTDTVDLIGELGIDPGSEWPVGSGSTKEHTLVRMPSVQQGTADWTIGATQWLVFPQNTFDSLGAHTQDPCPTGPADCRIDLFISEYIEGSSNNKGIEIYNPLDDTVDLANYQVYNVGNGGSFTNTFDLIGMLAPGEVYVITTDQADSVMQAQADTVLGFPSIVHFNGDDAISIVNLVTTDTVDIIGEFFVDPGSEWPVGSGSTKEHTLVRSPYVQAGTADWAVGATQWIVLPQNTFDSLGAHTMFPCGTMPPALPDTATVSFVNDTETVSEGAGNGMFSLEVTNFMDSIGVEVVLDAAASTATNGVDFAWTDTTISFPDSQSISAMLSFPITDDSDIEGAETVVFNLINVTTGAKIGVGTVVVTINDNDYPAYPIGDLTADADGDGVGDSLGVVCQIQGIVHGVDLQGTASTNLLFTVIDSTGGMGVFSGNDTTYTVTEGDEVVVIGTVEQFNGLTQMGSVIEINLISQNNPTFEPVPVTVLDESTESEMVKLECVTILDTTFNGGSGINFNVTNTIDTFQIRIDNNVDLYNGPAPTAKWLDISGIGGQFDSSVPRTEGYQLLPRYAMDIFERPRPLVSFADATATYDESDATAEASVTIASGNPDTTTVSVEVSSTSTATQGTDFALADTTFSFFGCGDDSVSLPLGIVDDSDVEGDETIVLVITTVTNGDISIDTLTITITETDNISELLPSSAIKLYPNPAKVNIQWEANIKIEQMTISNLMGQEVIKVANPEANGQMNISQLPAGVYIIRMETKEGRWMQKWMKE